MYIFIVAEDKPECDMLTLYFNATKSLPRNQMRTLVSDADNALRAIGGAEKMLASVYGIAITAMSFFADPTISTLTSGTPSQNVDLAGLSFPRRLGFRMDATFMKKYHLKGMQVVWQAYEDAMFTKSYGKDFYHEDLINQSGWCRFYFKGIFPTDVAYLKCQVKNAQTGQFLYTFYFKFVKTYQTTLNGRTYVKDPILGNKIVHNGILTELRPVMENGMIKGYKEGHTTYETTKLYGLDTSEPTIQKVKVNVITGYMQRYSEKQKMVFLVTPPHLMKYAKLILILVKQLVDLNFDQSYMTKDNQKPLYKTRFMLDELGNLQSEGHGISGFETMLSIGLGQEQQFTLILQTLQQLRDVYGESVDKIVQGNTSNIVFLKSTDDSMIETLQKMSGTQHRAYINSKTITKDTEKLILQNEGKTSYTMTVQEEPVIKYNDMAFISERNSIVFRAGDSPIWNRNETILPMSWKLHSNTIKQPGREFTFQTVPTLSSAKDFDIRMNMPDFASIVEQRMKESLRVEDAMQTYQQGYGYTDADIARLDIDLYASDVMDIVQDILRNDTYGSNDSQDDMYWDEEENIEQVNVTKQIQEEDAKQDEKKFAGKSLAPSNLWKNGCGIHQYDDLIIKAFWDCRDTFYRDTAHFSYNSEENILRSSNGEVFLQGNRVDVGVINKAAKNSNTRTYAEGDLSEADVPIHASMIVTDVFLKFLATQDTWENFASGKFEEKMARLMQNVI